MKLFDWNNSVERDLNMIYRSIEELENKMHNLYKKDFHDFSRPKVDILEDGCDKFEQSVWIEMSKLQDRIKELEGKKK